jgi:hypothetical protein
MFRRRRLIRPVMSPHLPVGVPAGAKPRVPPVVARAHNLMAEERYEEAAEAYSQIAEVARSRGGPRAPFFLLQAGRAFVLSGKLAEGMERINEGLQLLADAGRWSELHRVGQNIVNQLSDQGHAEASRQVAGWLEKTLAGKPVAPSVGRRPAAQPVLPTRCPGCGASVNPKEVEWLDERTAQCDFCGGSLRAEA